MNKRLTEKDLLLSKTISYEYTDEEIMKARYDEFAFDDLFMEPKSISIRKFMARRFFPPSGHTYEDLHQMSDIGFWLAVRDYKPGKMSFNNFAKEVIKRVLITFIVTVLRKKHNHLNNSSSLDDVIYNHTDSDSKRTLYEKIEDKKRNKNDALSLVIGKENNKEIFQIMKKHLSSLEYNCSILRNIEGLEYTEIARLTRTSIKTVDNALQRVKIKLKKKEVFKEIMNSYH